MIALLLSATLSATVIAPPARPARVTAPCQAVPALCLSHRSDGPQPMFEDAPEPDQKMKAYRFDPWPCRLMGNMRCPKRANRTLFRLGP